MKKSLQFLGTFPALLLGLALLTHNEAAGTLPYPFESRAETSEVLHHSQDPDPVLEFRSDPCGSSLEFVVVQDQFLLQGEESSSRSRPCWNSSMPTISMPWSTTAIPTVPASRQGRFCGISESAPCNPVSLCLPES